MCEYAPNREAAMVVLERDAGGNQAVDVAANEESRDG